MDQTIKQELHQLIDNCKDEQLLEDARALLKNGNDWWDSLDETDRQRIAESEEQYRKGDFIRHDELLQRFREWKKK